MNIVMTRLQNIGDMLNFIPALRTMRRAVPQSRITVLAKHAGGLEILKGCPYCDRVVLAPKAGAIIDKFRLFRELRQFGPIDYFLVSPQDLGRVPWAVMCGARHISAYPYFVNYGEVRREKWISRIDLPCLYDQNATEVENCLQPVAKVLEHLGLPLPGAEDLALEYSWYGQAEKGRARRLLLGCGIEAGRPFVAAAPVSKREAKNWPADRLARLLRTMQKEWKAEIVLLGGPAEREALESLALDCPSCHCLAGRTTLGESAAIIGGAAMYFGVDSGPAFLAAALGIPSVVLYGPADFYRWRPPVVTAPRIEIFRPFPCGPCREQTCPVGNACLAAIGYDEVWQACQRCYSPLATESRPLDGASEGPLQMEIGQ